MTASSSSNASDALGPVQQLLQQGEVTAALETLDRLPEGAQKSVMGQYMRGVSLRLLRDFTNAETVLRELVNENPSYGRAFQELGHLYRDANMVTEALNAYATACHLNPGLKASWVAQSDLLGRNSPERVAQINQRVQWLEALPPNLLASWDLLHEGKLHKAEQLCRQFMQQNPQHIDGMRVLAEIAARHGVLEDAEFLLESAIEFEPAHRQARIDYVQILSKRQRFQRAVDEASTLLEQAPDNPQLQSLFAIQCMQLGDYESALELFDKILSRVPSDPVTNVSKGHALKTGGRSEEAITAYRAALKSQPFYCDAWYSLANLKVYQFDDEELSSMQALDEKPTFGGARIACICSSLWVRRLRIGRIINSPFTITPKATQSRRRNCNTRQKAPLRSARIKSPRVRVRFSIVKLATQHLIPSLFLGCHERARPCLSRFSRRIAWWTARWSCPMYCRSAANCAD